MSLLRGLSGRLLILTVLVVMLAEVAIFVPSVARFRYDYLIERVVRAQIASLTVLAAEDRMVSPELQRHLLARTEALNVVMHSGGTRMLVLSSGDMPEVAATFDLRRVAVVELIADAMARLVRGGDDVIRVIGQPGFADADAIEITLDSRPLRQAMFDYGRRILELSMAISIVTAATVFVVARRIVVWPLMRVIENVRTFQQNPEDPSRVIRPDSSVGEVAAAEQALAAMQKDVLTALRERARLASLGEALAKISHDLRNILSTAQIMADRLETSRDPLVARTLPKLIGSLDRAISLCQRTLDYGRVEETAPELRQVRLRALAEEVAEGLGLAPAAQDTADGQVRCHLEIAQEFTLLADPEQLYRVLANLMRNAAEAIQSSGRPGDVHVSVEGAETKEVSIRVRDTGPGMPAKALDNLFRPFRGGIRRGGAGLGLAIAQELVRAHGGQLELISSTTEGTEFVIHLPAGAPATG